MSRPRMRFVPTKTAEQQWVMALRRVREGLKEERTVCSHRNRGSGSTGPVHRPPGATRGLAAHITK